MKKVLLVFFICNFSLCLLAQNPIFKIEVNTDTLIFGERMEVQFQIENIKGDFKAPKFEDFIVLSGPNTQNQMQWINGSFSSSKNISFILSPKKLGPCKIEGVSIKHGKETLETDEIIIICVDGSIKHNGKKDSQPFQSHKKSVLAKAKRHKT